MYINISLHENSKLLRELTAIPPINSQERNSKYSKR